MKTGTFCLAAARRLAYRGVIVLGLGISSSANAGTLTFDDLPHGTELTNQYAALGVTSSGGTVLRAVYSGITPPSEPNFLVARSDTISFFFNPAITGPVNSVSGYVTGNPATTMFAYDASGNLLGQASLPSTGGTNVLLTVTSPTATIVRVVLQDPNSPAIDNFTFANSPATPKFTFTGFFPPVDNSPALNTVKAGSAIPVKFSLGSDKGLDILAQGYPTSTKVACDASVPTDAIEETVTSSNSGLSYDAASQQYVYVWKTDKSWSSSCRQLTVRLNDGTERKAMFQFTR